MPGKKFEKARIVIKDSNNKLFDTIVVHFNPEEYTVSTASSTVTKNSTKGKQANREQIPRSVQQTLAVKLLFDTYHEKETVKKHTDRLLILLQQDELQASYKCEFIWGKFSFEGMVESLTQKYTMFLEDGTPVRANMEISIKAQDKVVTDCEAIQNKESKFEGKSLAEIMNETAKQNTDWKRIAKEKSIDNPRIGK